MPTRHRAVLGLFFLTIAMPVGALDLNDPTTAIETWVRLKGDSGGKLTYEWVSGTAYGIPFDSPGQPLFRLESVTIRQFQRQGPGRYTEQTFSCRLYRDTASNAFIDRWLNPYTQVEIDLKPGCGVGPTVIYSPETVELASDIPFTSSALDGPMQLHVVESGDNYIIRRDAHSEFTASPEAAPRRETSEDTFTVPKTIVSDNRSSHWLPNYHWSAVTEWMRSLKIQDRPGRMLWSIDGRNYLHSDELPKDFRLAVDELQPGALQHSFQWE